MNNSMIFYDFTSDPIFYVPEADAVTSETLEPGWYFYCEVIANPVGPWESEAEAREAFVEHSQA